MQQASGLLLLLLLSPRPIFSENLLLIPFFNPNNIREIDWIGDSIAERLAEALSAAGQPVVDRSEREELLRQMAVQRYAVLTHGTLAEIAFNLDASRVVFGDFEWTPEREGEAKDGQPGTPRGQIRLQAHIMDVRAVRRGPSMVVSGPIEELSLLESELAWQVVVALGRQGEMTKEEFLRRHPPIRLDALESYVRGLLATSYEQKLQLLAQAWRLENSYTQPCFHLGMLLLDRRDYRQAAEWLQRVTEADLHFREAMFYLGICLFQAGDYTGAGARFAKVSETAPLAEVWNNLGVAEIRLNRIAAAVDYLKKAVGMDPSHPDTHFNLGYALWKAGEWEQSAAAFRHCLQRKPDDQDATLLLGRCLSRSGPRPGEVRVEGLERLIRQYNEKAWFALQQVLRPKPAPEPD